MNKAELVMKGVLKKYGYCIKMLYVHMSIFLTIIRKNARLNVENIFMIFLYMPSSYTNWELIIHIFNLNDLMRRNCDTKVTKYSSMRAFFPKNFRNRYF